jgi:hypothetical protein
MEIKSMQDHNEQESINEAWAHQDYSGYEQKHWCSPRFMINKQYRKKTLKGSFLTKQQRRRPNSQNHRQKKKKTPLLRAETIFDNRGRTTP